MKKYILLVSSAVLGSVLTLLIFSSFQTQKGSISDNVTSNSGQKFVQQASFNAMSINSSTTDFTIASKKIMPSVVHIATKVTVRGNSMPHGFDLWQEFFGPQFNVPQGESNIQKGSGSGVIVSQDGYIVTNNHVIKDADEITVTLNNKQSFIANVIGTDPNTDIALIKIESNELPPITFSNSDNVEVGEWVLACGNPFNLNSTVTAGIVSAKGRNINILKQQYAIESFIQTDAAINPGNSGGALVNTQGDLIGINTAIASPTGSYSGYGFAVPSNIVTKVIRDLKEYGVVQRAFIGISIQDVNSKLVEEHDLDITEGVFVNSLIDNGAGKKAGLKEGDIITKINGTTVNSTSELQEIVASKSPGDVVDVTVDRKGDEEIYSLTLTNKEGNLDITEKTSIDVFAKLGIEVKDADKSLLSKLGKKNGVQITDISEGTIKKNTNMKPGFVITKVDNTPIKDVDQLAEIMGDKKGGIMIEGVYPNMFGTYYYAFGM